MSFWHDPSLVITASSVNSSTCSNFSCTIYMFICALPIPVAITLVHSVAASLTKRFCVVYTYIGHYITQHELRKAAEEAHRVVPQLVWT